jgi:hypothetical protein
MNYSCLTRIVVSIIRFTQRDMTYILTMDLALLSRVDGRFLPGAHFAVFTSGLMSPVCNS